jgi:hypothetical protein
VRFFAGVLVLALGHVLGVAAASGDEPCRGSDTTAIFTSPRTPAPGGTLRVMAVAERPLDGTLVVLGPAGEQLGAGTERRGGPPFWWYVEVSPPGRGDYRVILADGHERAACQEVRVDGHAPALDGSRGVWPVTRDWSRATENLFSAWVEKLFDDPLDAEPSWHALHEVTRDPVRNFLHDHLGLGEDDAHGLRLEPDCADLPYFLRAYFAWKLGLPFAYSECSRGEDGRPPRCTRTHTNLEPVDGGTPLARAQRFFMQNVAWTVQSGAGRAPADDDRTDLYPIRLTAETLRPGTVYADPYGHTLVVVRRVPQTPATGGILLAVDAQPDETIARKRYWRGNFLFAVDPSLGSAGFKHFRPVVRDGSGLRELGNREIAARPDYGDWSLEQYASGAEGFYDTVDAVLSPSPLEPARALHETIDALDEQVHARVRSVANGETYEASHRETIPMPEGAAIFETTGAWEDYATPARDLRLLIAIDVARGFPEKVATHAERFAVPAGRSADQVRAELDELLAGELRDRRFEYVRSDGSPWTLTLADLVGRAEALETAYDPNDCVEVRWGAPPGSAERATCGRRAPAEQQARMARYQEWFHDRRRPPR